MNCCHVRLLMGLALLWESSGRAAENDPREAKQITPNSIRVESLMNPGEGHWIVLKGYREIGSPVLSPDNQSVAFDARQRGYGNSPGEIWIAHRDGSELRKLVNGATPRWSPDGKQILFSRQDGQGVSFVRLIGVDGKNERTVCEGSWPDWSPDGSQIVYAHGGTPGGGAKFLSRIYVSKPDGSQRQLMAAGDCPSWSPDGKRIACCFRDPALPAPLIRVIDLSQNRERFAGVGWFRANWLPESTHLVANGPIARQKLGTVKLNALEKVDSVPIYTDFEGVLSPHWSRDGAYRVYIAQKPTP